MFKRRISLIDTASQFLNGLTGGDRSTESSFILGYNKKALSAIFILATALRDYLERIAVGKIDIDICAIALEEIDVGSNPRYKMLSEVLLPNAQVQDRTISRTLWSVKEEDYLRFREEPTTGVSKKSGSKKADDEEDNLFGKNYLLDDYDDDEGAPSRGSRYECERNDEARVEVGDERRPRSPISDSRKRVYHQCSGAGNLEDGQDDYQADECGKNEEEDDDSQGGENEDGDDDSLGDLMETMMRGLMIQKTNVLMMRKSDL